MVASFLSGTEDNIEKYNNWIFVLQFLPDYGLKHGLSIMFITFTKAQQAKQNYNLGKSLI